MMILPTHELQTAVALIPQEIDQAETMTELVDIYSELIKAKHDLKQHMRNIETMMGLAWT